MDDAVALRRPLSHVSLTARLALQHYGGLTATNE